jgi:DEAD/DEAH box helicase domain-containing protein
VTRHVIEPSREARLADWPAGIHPRVRQAYQRRGIPAPYTHQARAMELAAAGRDVVVVTPTASGKTLCYSAPLLSRCLEQPDARALLLFPTKALSLDQVMSLREVLAEVEAGADEELPEIPISTFDGDTPADARRSVRRRGRLVVTNPDMLHSGILPHHPRWASLFQGLTHVVIDELHAYRGVFGSHLANVLRRLQRICRFHGSDPTFILCSATIANPKDHAETLTGRPVELVDESGAPRGERHLVFYNPPVVNPELGLRASARGAARRIASRSLTLGLQTLVFATSRLSVEILTKYLKDSMARARKNPRLVEGYRGGYLPKARRRIQEGLRSGDLRGVVSTNALELGIDVGSLDVALLCGYPGSIASTWQQLGRAGRRGRPSVCVIVARSTPLDQYLIQRPEFFLDASPEHARCDPDNLLVEVEHLKCAAFELPFRDGEGFGGLGEDGTRELLELFAEEGIVLREGDVWHWTQESHPAEAVNLRSVSSDNFIVVDVTRPAHRVIAEVDFPSAPTTIHEKAIYMVGAEQYQVEHLDYDNRKAFVRSVDCDYFTDAMTYRKVKVLESFAARAHGSSPGDRAPAGGERLPSVLVHHGEVRVSRKVVGFKKVRFYTGENLGYGDVVLPEHEMHVPACWLTLGAPAIARLLAAGLSRREIVEALVGVSKAAHAVACVLVACDRRDLGTAIGDARGTGEGNGAWFEQPAGRTGSASLDEGGQALDLEELERFEPTLFLHETIPGGNGFSPLLFEERRLLVHEAQRVVEGCGCVDGCPACVGPPLEVGERCREHAVLVLAELSGALGGGGALEGAAP